MARVWEEARMVVRRQNQMLTSAVSLLQLAIGSLFSKESGQTLKETIEGLSDE